MIDRSNHCLESSQTAEFLKQIKPRSIITVHGETLEVLEVISDTQIRLKTPLTEELAQKLIESEAEFKVSPFVDQSDMFATVVDKLLKGQCVGIFPEGGSHDRSEFLPLKAGFTIMALNALAKNPNLGLKIIPVGLNYFHPDRFRSRAVLEYGVPIEIPNELVVCLFKAVMRNGKRASESWS